MAFFIAFACFASLLGRTWSEDVESDPADDGILYVGRKMLERVQTQLDQNEDVSHEMMSKLLGFLPDDEIMTPVDVNGVDVDFVSIDVWLQDLGARGTAKALVKAAHYYKESKTRGAETQTPQFVGTLMLEQARDKLAMDEEVTDDDVAKMLGFLPDERSFVALDLSRHGHDLSDIDAWLSNQGLKGAAEACVAAARSDSGVGISSPSTLSQETLTNSEDTPADTEDDATTSDLHAALEIQAEPAQVSQIAEAESAEQPEDEAANTQGVTNTSDLHTAFEEEAALDEEAEAKEQEEEEESAEAANTEGVANTSDLHTAFEEEAALDEEAEAEEQEEEEEWESQWYYFDTTDLAEEEVNVTSKSESNPPSASDTPPQRVRWCTLNPGCEQYQGLCCPDTRGRMLDCCSTASAPASTDPATNLQAPWDEEDDGVYFPKFAGSWR